MVAQDVPHTQPPDDPPPCCICPHCGHRHSAYDPQASALLDCLLEATDALRSASAAVRTVKAVIEQEVLP